MTTITEPRVNITPISIEKMDTPENKELIRTTPTLVRGRYFRSMESCPRSINLIAYENRPHLPRTLNDDKPGNWLQSDDLEIVIKDCIVYGYKNLIVIL